MPLALRLYTVAMVTLALCLFPFAAIALVARPRWRVGLRERLGGVPATEAGRPAIWIHGASVGEITALAPIVRTLRRELPAYRLVVSTSTPGGREAAAARIPEADARVLFPFDVPWAVRRALTAVSPRLVLFSETELWPNFLATVARRGVPAIMVSGRVSARAFGRYRRWRRLFAPALAGVRVFCVQSLETARRLVALGAPRSRVVVTGSVKAAAPDGLVAGATSLASLGCAGDAVLVAGSTHAGEEEAVLAAFARIRVAVPEARLLLAPRKPERFDEVARALSAAGLRFVRRSELARGARWPSAVPIVLLDSLGELAALYPGARAAFVGGTLVPVGGHNVLEPAAAGVPVVFGPYVEHTRDAALRLLAAGAAVEVGDADALARVLVAWFTNPEEARAVGARAATAAVASDGAVAVTLAVIRGVLAADDAVAGPT